MTPRQRIAMQYVQACYVDGTLRPDTPKADIPVIASNALLRDIGGFIANELRQRGADVVQRIADLIRGVPPRT